MSQPKVKSKWGSEKDTMPNMTTAAVTHAEALKSQLAEMSGPQRKAVTDVLQYIYDARMQAGNNRIMTLTVPTVLIHMTNPDNK